MNTVTHEQEVPDNDQMIFVKRVPIQFNELPHEIVIKCSRKHFFQLKDIRMYSTAQILNNDKKEIWHELYASILTEQQADKMIEKIKSNLSPFIDGKEIDN